MILAFDTATPVGSVALADEEKVLVGRYFDLGLQHSQRLFVEIDEVLKVVGVLPRQVEVVAVTSGPGSFTGLRLGMSAAKGFCLATGAALVLVPTLEGLAARLPYAQYPVCTLLDARKAEVYAALYDTAEGVPRLLAGPRAVTPADLLAERAGAPTIYTGDGALAYRKLIAASGASALLAPAYCARPEAGAIALLGLIRLRMGVSVDLATAEPQYLRDPDVRVAGPFLP